MAEQILVVDDDELVRESLVLELECAGYRVMAASGGPQALELARQHPFEAVISDIRMAGMDGLETLAKLREICPQTRRILITGYADPQAPVTAIKLGVDDYLLKPFTSDELLGSLRKCLTASWEELRQRRSSQSLRHFLLDLIEHWKVSPREEIARVERAALGRARLMGLSPARLQTLKLACWMQGLESSLEAIEELQHLLPILRARSECDDGTGPLGLELHQIPLETRLLKLAQQPGEGGDENDPALLLSSFDSNLSSSLALARAYLEKGEWQRCQQVLDQVSPAQAEQQSDLDQIRVQLLLAQGQQREAQKLALAAWRRSTEAGLSLHSATWVLILVENGALSPIQAEQELGAARAVFQLWQAGSARARADLNLAILENSPERLSQALGDCPDLWAQQGPRLLKFFQDLLQTQGAQSLSACLRQAQERGLAVLEGLLQGDSPNPVKLKALDLLAEIDSPRAQALLARVSASGGSLAAHKSALLQKSDSSYLYLLGRFRYCWKGQDVDEALFATRKTRNLFAYMASRRGQFLAEDHLMDLFWATSEGKAKHSLHNSISQIRKALKELHGKEYSPLQKKTDGYLLLSDTTLHVDLEEFQECLKQARLHRDRPDELSRLLLRAEQLYQGDYLEGVYEDWVESLRGKLAAQYSELLAELALGAQQRGQHEVGLESWKRLLQRDNCHEDAYEGAMQCLEALGRPAEAIRLYHQCAQTLRKELQVSPPPRLVERYLRLTGSEAR